MPTYLHKHTLRRTCTDYTHAHTHEHIHRHTDTDAHACTQTCVHTHTRHTCTQTDTCTHRDTQTQIQLCTHTTVATRTLPCGFTFLPFSPSTRFMYHPWTRVRLPGSVARLGHVSPAQAAETEAWAHIDVSQSGGWKSEMGVPAGALVTTCFLLHAVPTWGTETASSSSSPHHDLMTSLKPHFLKPSPWGLWFQHEFGGGTQTRNP